MSKCKRCGNDPCTCKLPSRPGEWKPKPQPWPTPKATMVWDEPSDPYDGKKPGCWNPFTVSILLVTVGLLALGFFA